YLVDFQVDLGDEVASRTFSSILSKTWQRVFPEWEDFYTNLEIMRLERALSGIGIMLKEDPRDWKFTPVDTLDFYLPQGGQIRGQSLSKFAIRRKWAAQVLWEKYLDADDPYWNKELLGR